MPAETLSWEWDQRSWEEHPDILTIDKKKQAVKFHGGIGQKKMLIVKRDTPLQNNFYHSWTFKTISSLGEFMVGVVTKNAELLEKSYLCHRLGEDKQSWGISSVGVICHDNTALKHKDYKIYQRNYITVHLDLINRTLMFAINDKMIGYQYFDIPSSLDWYPAVAASNKCELHLVSYYSWHPSLQLAALLACTYIHCKKSLMKVEKKRPLKVPKNSRLLWHGSVLLDGSNLPPGLVKTVRIFFPTLISGHSAKKSSRTKSLNLNCSSIKELTCSPPKIIRFNSFYKRPKTVAVSDRRPMNRVVRRPRCLCKEDNCGHAESSHFIRRRDVYYVSSSDEEIFPAIVKKRKKMLKKKVV